MNAENPDVRSSKKTSFSAIFYVFMAILLMIASIYLLFIYKANKGAVLSATVSSSRLDEPTARQEIHKSFQINVRGNEEKILYTIQKAELRKSLIINNAQPTANEGNIFLVLYLKLVNDTRNQLQVNTDKTIFLRVNNKINALSPDITENIVSIPPLYFTYSRVVFVVKETERNFLVEIQTGDTTKESLPLQLK